MYNTRASDRSTRADRPARAPAAAAPPAAAQLPPRVPVQVHAQPCFTDVTDTATGGPSLGAAPAAPPPAATEHDDFSLGGGLGAVAPGLCVPVNPHFPLSADQYGDNTPRKRAQTSTVWEHVKRLKDSYREKNEGSDCTHICVYPWDSTGQLCNKASMRNTGRSSTVRTLTSLSSAPFTISL